MRPTLEEMAIEADCWRSYADASNAYANCPSARNEARKNDARNALLALGIHAFSPSAVDRVSAPEGVIDGEFAEVGE